MSKFIINSYQTPYIYIDDYLAKLTGNEWKVLSYACRRICGFQKDNDRISVSQFANGLEGKDLGTGLSEATCTKILKTLADYGLMIKVADNDPRTNKGTLWQLQQDGKLVNNDLIEQEYQKRLNKNNKKTQKAREANPLVPNIPTHVEQGLGGDVEHIAGGDVEQGTQYTVDNKIDNKNNYVSAANALPDVEDSLDQPELISVKKKRKPRKPNPVHNAVAKLQELEPTFKKGFGHKIVKELFEEGYTEDDIVGCALELQQRDWWIENNIQITPSQIKKHIGSFVQEQQIDEFGNYVEVLPDGTQVITLKSEIIQDSNVVVIE